MADRDFSRYWAWLWFGTTTENVGSEVEGITAPAAWNMAQRCPRKTTLCDAALAFFVERPERYPSFTGSCHLTLDPKTITSLVGTRSRGLPCQETCFRILWGTLA